ncbi:MAG: HisS family protein, partial [Armatimonadota bacterium]
YKSLGYNLVETPNLEPSEILAKENGVGDQPVYTFIDKHRDNVALKPDQTVSLRRLIEQHDLRLPFMRHQVGFAFRQDKPERGRCREFTQCDADVIGAPLGVADAETILWLQKGFIEIGLPETILSVNARGILTGLYKSLKNEYFDELTFVRAIDKCPVDGDTSVVDRYLNRDPSNDLEDVMKPGFNLARYEATRQILDLLKKLLPLKELPVWDALAQFEALFSDLETEISEVRLVLEYCDSLGVSMENIRFDPCLARGMDYYTGPVFEARHPLWTFGSLAGGGRYDRMVKIRDEAQPAVGASFGLERIEQTLRDLDRMPDLAGTGLADVLIATRPDWMPGPLKLATELRKTIGRVLVFPDPTASFKMQTKFASENGIKYIVFYGPDEAEAGEATIRTLTDGDITDVQAARQSKNQKVTVAELSDTLLALLAE